MSSEGLDSLQVSRFAYDAAGERVAAWQRGSQGQLLDVTVFLRDEGGRVLSDWQLIPGVSFGPKRDYLYAGDRLAVQLDWSEGELPVRQYIAVDHLNSTRAIVDDNGNLEEIDYLPFGGFLTGDPQPDTTHLFTGHERDTAEFASNLDYMHARYFSPNLGRFLSVDPVGGEVGSSQPWNRYSYVLNNPLTHTDPHGLAVKVLDELALEYIRSTLPDVIQDQVVLDEAGLIDKALLNAVESDDPSLLDLRGLVNLDPVVEVSTGSSFTVLDAQGLTRTENFLYLPPTAEGPANMFLGYTVGPASGPNVYEDGYRLSTNANVQVTLSNDPSVPPVEMQRTTAEELYGHALLYLAGKPFLHGSPGVEEFIEALKGRYPR